MDRDYSGYVFWGFVLEIRDLVIKALSHDSKKNEENVNKVPKAAIKRDN